MATATSTTISQAAAAPASRALALMRSWLRPSLSDAFFLAVFIWLFLAAPGGWKALLMDGDAGWHIRTGQYILDYHAVPRHDLFSFSMPGAPWFAWEWLSDVVFAVLFRIAGLKAVVLFAGVLIGIFATLLLRYAVWRGANALVALILTLLAIGSATIHFLARPHLFTLVLLPAALWVIAADRRSPRLFLWLLVPLVALWTNLHGGFAMFLALLILLVAGTACEAWLFGGSWRPVWRYAILLGVCCGASLLTPYGTGLVQHIFEYLKSDWIRDYVQEFQAPTFRSEGQLQFEILLLAGTGVAARLLARGNCTEAFWLLFLAHASLVSVRHAPLYAALAAPLIAVELSLVWGTRFAGVRNSSAQILYRMGEEIAPLFRWNSLWVAAALAGTACLGAAAGWPSDFPSEAFPVATVHRYAGLLQSHRVFTSDQWADYLIYSGSPGQKVFFDGRSDFYGKRLGRDYLTLMQGAPGWQSILARFRIDAVLIPPDWPLAELLRLQGDWKVEARGSGCLLFSLRTQPDSTGAPSARREIKPAAAARPNENAIPRRSTNWRAMHG